MPTFEVQHPDGRTFEVQAPNMQAASEALTGALSDSDLMAALNRSKAPSEMSDAELMSALKPPPGFVLDQPSTAASTGLAKFRQQYPQYNDMSDSKLADSLYNRFYSDMPRAEFDAKLGLKSGGMFDDLIPSRNAGMFDDLIPKQTAASTALDVAKQLGAGAVIALENVAAAPAKLSGLTGELVDYLYPPDPEAAAQQESLRNLIAVNRGNGISDYLPAAETPYGQAARTAAEWLTPAVGLTGSLARDIATGAAAGLGSEGLGAAFKGTAAEPAARGVGAALGGLAGARQGAGRAAANVTAEELKAAARPVFEEAAQTGNTIAVAGEDIAAGLRADLHEAALRQSNAPRTCRELARLSGAEDLNDVAIARDKMRDIANGISDNRFIRVAGSDSTAARKAMNALDGELEQLSPGWTAAMKEADSNWAAAKRAEAVAKAADKNRLGSFGNNNTKGFTPEEIAAVRRASNGGAFGAGLSGIGAALNPLHAGLTGGIGKIGQIATAIGTGGASLPAQLGMMPVGYVADKAAAALRQRALDQATQQILSRSPLAQQRGAVVPIANNRAAILAALAEAQRGSE